ncbi:MAG: winged helix-turn-helix domain-containing protein [Myxococcota bacterium]
MLFVLGAARVDLTRGEIQRGTNVLALTAMEIALLGHLARHAGRDCARDTLLREVWGYRAGLPSRAVDFTVHRLRRKLEPEPSAPVHLVAAPGRGYRLDGVRLVEDNATAAARVEAVPPTLGPDTLYGRDQLVAALGEWRGGPPAVLALVGPGGVGKTRLARLLAGVFVDLTGATDSEGVAPLVATALGVPPGAIWPACRAVGLLVLDNAEHVADGVDQLLARAGAPPPCHVLLTSRITPTRTPAWEVPLLAEPDSVALLRARAPIPLDDEDRALAALAAALGNLPLALEHAAGRLGVVRPEALRRRLVDGAVGLVSTPGHPEARHASLDALLAWSWTLLVPAERRLLLRALAFATPFDFDAAEAIAGLDTVTLANAHDALVRHHWLLREADGRFAYSPPVRAWLRTVDPTECAAGEAAHIAWTRGAEAPLPERLVALDRARDPADVVPLARELPADRFGPDEPIARRAARLDRAVALAPDDAVLRWARGMAHALAGNRAAATIDLDEALAFARRDGDRATEGLALGQLGNLAAYAGDPDRASERFAAAVAILDAAGRAHDARIFLANLGNARLVRGDLDGAEAAFTATLARMVEQTNGSNRGRVHTNLGNVYAARGAGALADAHYARAEALFREANDRMCLGQLLGNLGLRRLDVGALDEAAALVAEALALHRALGNRRSEGYVLLTAGDLALERGALEALDTFARARLAFEEVGDRRMAGWAAWMSGRARALTGAGGAREALREGVTTLRERGDGEGLARAAATLALLEPVERPGPHDEVGAAMWGIVDGTPADPALAARSHDVRLQARLATASQPR